MKVELTSAKLAKLRQKAETVKKLLQNPWKLDHYYVSDEESDFIAEADPATVLAMLDEIEQLRRMERKWGQMLKNVKDTAPDLETFLSPDAFKINESEAGQ